MKEAYSKLLLIACMALLVTPACSRASKCIPVVGKVSVDGKPASGAVLIFIQEGAGMNAVSSSAVAEGDGSFHVLTGNDRGMPLGTYRVSIAWPDKSKKLTPSQIMQGASPEDGPDKLKGKYSNSQTSSLRAEIKSGMSDLAPFELES